MPRIGAVGKTAAIGPEKSEINGQIEGVFLPRAVQKVDVETGWVYFAYWTDLEMDLMAVIIHLYQ